MLLTRWKLMAGILGISIGGLAAAASQCPKFDSSKGRSPEGPVAKADTKVAPAGPATTPAAPPTLEIPAVPAAPQLTPAGSTPAPMVETPKPTTPTTPPAPPAPTVEFPKFADVAPSTLPPIPMTTGPAVPKPMDPKPESKPTEPSKPLLPAKPEAGPPTTPSVPPLPGELFPPAPGKPTPPTTPPAPPVIDGRDLVGKPNIAPIGGVPSDPGKPVASPPNAGSAPANPPAGGFPPGFGTAPPVPPDSGPTLPPPPMGGMSAPAMPPAGGIEHPIGKGTVPPVAESKFRILLRVGDGEPMFEVRHGDNLMLKVACEKVDIKSPEKGGGLSEVTARGKVRFAGFGAEGTCDELKFMAGTGEVSMSGDVKVQVKDKLGRVESELTTASMKYKIDASAVGGQIKP